MNDWFDINRFLIPYLYEQQPALENKDNRIIYKTLPSKYADSRKYVGQYSTTILKATKDIQNRNETRQHHPHVQGTNEAIYNLLHCVADNIHFIAHKYAQAHQTTVKRAIHDLFFSSKYNYRYDYNTLEHNLYRKNVKLFNPNQINYYGTSFLDKNDIAYDLDISTRQASRILQSQKQRNGQDTEPDKHVGSDNIVYLWHVIDYRPKISHKIRHQRELKVINAQSKKNGLLNNLLKYNHKIHNLNANSNKYLEYESKIVNVKDKLHKINHLELNNDGVIITDPNKHKRRVRIPKIRKYARLLKEYPTGHKYISSQRVAIHKVTYGKRYRPAKVISRYDYLYFLHEHYHWGVKPSKKRIQTVQDLVKGNTKHELANQLINARIEKKLARDEVSKLSRMENDEMEYNALIHNMKISNLSTPVSPLNPSLINKMNKFVNNGQAHDKLQQLKDDIHEIKSQLTENYTQRINKNYKKIGNNDFGYVQYFHNMTSLLIQWCYQVKKPKYIHQMIIISTDNRYFNPFTYNKASRTKYHLSSSKSNKKYSGFHLPF